MQNMTLYFYNDTVIPEEAITTFGINAKIRDSAIGYFGTGLKYAIAVILREGGTISIKSGPATYTFTQVDKEIRGKDFKLVLCNGKPAGFTTELGKKWEPWMAFRELYCNALDEGGNVSDAPINKTTVITVDCAVLQDAYYEKAGIVLESKPVYTGKCVDIHPGKSSYIYYRGVRIQDLKSPTLYTYNIKDRLDITEDRTAKYYWQSAVRITDELMRCDNEDIIRAALLAPKEAYEHHFDYAEASEADTKVFDRIAKELQHNIYVNQSIYKYLRQRGLQDRPSALELDPMQSTVLTRAVDFCTSAGFPVATYDIVVSGDLRGGVHGLAENGVIYLSIDTLDLGVKYTISTLIEEYIHLNTGYGDMTRELQTYLFNTIVTLCERIKGDPL